VPKLAEEHHLTAVVGRVIEKMVDELSERISVFVNRALFQQGFVRQPRDERSLCVLQLGPTGVERSNGRKSSSGNSGMKRPSCQYRSQPHSPQRMCSRVP
jgi:hypothetical protein